MIFFNHWMYCKKGRANISAYGMPHIKNARYRYSHRAGGGFGVVGTRSTVDVVDAEGLLSMLPLLPIVATS